MLSTRSLQPPSSARRTAFTLIELLIVIGIIAILMAIVLAVGSRVANSGKYKLTKDVLNILDQSLTEYVSVKGAPPPALVLDPRAKLSASDPDVMQPLGDVLNYNADPSARKQMNSVGLYIRLCEDLPTVKTTFRSLDPKIIKSFDPDGADVGSPDWTKQGEMMTVFDGWGNPIRMVTPKFKGWIYGPDYSAPSDTTQPVPLDHKDLVGKPQPGTVYGATSIRRNDVVYDDDPSGDKPDGDGGICVGGRPYFYSAGPDGKVGYLRKRSTGEILEDYNADNLYSTRPDFQKN